LPDPRRLLRDIAELQRLQERVRIRPPAGLHLSSADDAQGKIPPSASKQKKVLGPHAKRRAAAKQPLNGSEAVKEKFSVIEKRRNREVKDLARKFQ
jgi:hypothetical protein